MTRTSHPVIPVKPLVGALAYVYGVLQVRTYGAYPVIRALERDMFMANVLVASRLAND